MNFIWLDWNRTLNVRKVIISYSFLLHSKFNKKTEKISGILDLLQSDLRKTIISGLANSTNTDVDKTSSALTMGMPVLMKALERNAKSSGGAEGLLNAISNKHDGSILNNIGGLLSSGATSQLGADGSKILGHILGSKQNGVVNIISQKVG